MLSVVMPIAVMLSVVTPNLRARLRFMFSHSAQHLPLEMNGTVRFFTFLLITEMFYFYETGQFKTKTLAELRCGCEHYRKVKTRHYHNT
jgi:hypothetical protein